MVDREKVIKGLECCHVQRNEAPPLCEDCPYMNPMEGTCDALDELLGDALTLLKAREPRVLTLEEVPDAVFCYLEYKAYGTIEPAIFGEAYTDDTVAFTTIEDGKDYLDLSDYCKAWRCWTSRPTDEQRKAAKWNG